MTGLPHFSQSSLVSQRMSSSPDVDMAESRGTHDFTDDLACDLEL